MTIPKRLVHAKGFKKETTTEVAGGERRGIKKN